MKLLMLLILVLTLGCDGESSEGTRGLPSKRVENSSQLKMQCVEIGPGRFAMYRCENTEVTCYTGNVAESIICKWKR